MALRRAQVAAALGVEAGGARLHALVHAVVRAAADLLLRRADRAPLLEARAEHFVTKAFMFFAVLACNREKRWTSIHICRV